MTKKLLRDCLKEAEAKSQLCYTFLIIRGVNKYDM